MAVEQRVEIKDFIGIFDGYVTDQACDDIIAYLHGLGKSGMVYSGSVPMAVRGKEGAAETSTALSYQAMHLPRPAVIIQPFFKAFWEQTYKQYMDKYPILTTSGTHSIFSMRLLKTPIGGNNPFWHTDDLSKVSPARVTSMTVFLNDVTEGGGIEFPQQNRRIQAKKGRMVIWPAAWTHIHKDNIPLSNEKYTLSTTLEIVA